MKPERIAELASMLEHMTETERGRLLANLAAQDPALAEELKRGLFSFTEIASLADPHLRLLIGAVERATLALALRSIDPELQARILACLPARAGQALLEEAQALGPRKLSEVKAAQQKIGEQARDLERASTIWRKKDGIET
jgi:flagellar motor switch protein FliG